MTAEANLAALLRINVEVAVVILLVLTVRPWVRRAAGPQVAYWLWLIVPIVATAGQLPAPKRVVVASTI